MVRGLENVDQLLPLTMAAYNLTRLRSLAALRPQSALGIGVGAGKSTTLIYSY